MPTYEMANKNKGQKKQCQEGWTNDPKKKFQEFGLSGILEDIKESHWIKVFNF